MGSDFFHEKKSDLCYEVSKDILTSVLKTLSSSRLTVFTAHIGTYLQYNEVSFTDPEIGVLFLKSGYIIYGHLPTLKKYNHSKKGRLSVLLHNTSGKHNVFLQPHNLARVTRKGIVSHLLKKV